MEDEEDEEWDDRSMTQGAPTERQEDETWDASEATVTTILDANYSSPPEVYF